MQKSTEHFYDAKSTGAKIGWTILGVVVILIGLVVAAIVFAMLSDRPTTAGNAMFALPVGIVALGVWIIKEKAFGSK